jgi:ribosomal protein S27E
MAQAPRRLSGPFDTVQRCEKCKSHQIAPVILADHTIIYRCLECGTVVTEPAEW